MEFWKQLVRIGFSGIKVATRRQVVCSDSLVWKHHAHMDCRCDLMFLPFQCCFPLAVCSELFPDAVSIGPETASLVALDVAAPQGDDVLHNIACPLLFDALVQATPYLLGV